MSVVHLGPGDMQAVDAPHRSGWATANFADLPDGVPGKLPFGPMRLCTLEAFAPGFEGFAMHRHHNVEVVTLMVAGQWTHRDSLGRQGELHPGDVQVMSAGTGLSHEERPRGSASVVQLWFDPVHPNTAPRVRRAHVSATVNAWVPVVGLPPAALRVDADVTLRRAALVAGYGLPLDVAEGRQCMVLVLEGEVVLEGRCAAPGERLVMQGGLASALRARRNTQVLAIDVPREPA